MECRLCNSIQDEEKIKLIQLCEQCFDKFFKWIHEGNANDFYPPNDCKFCGKCKSLFKARNYDFICIDCLYNKFCSKYQQGEIDAIENKETS